MLRYFLFFCVVLNTAACTTSQQQNSYGLNPDMLGYVPARIAVLSCSEWPRGAQYATQSASNIPPQQIQEICQQLDSEVLRAFSNQPFMQGYTPELVQRLLNKASKPSLLGDYPNLWQHEREQKETAQNAVATYTASIATSSSWRQWLHELSTACNYADAVLMPFIISATEQRSNDRGMLLAERGAELTVLLIDTNSGKLLWSGGRKAAVINQGLNTPDFPTWDKLYPRLFVEELWRAFPGRQTLNR